jgi:hypothetical protein
MPRFHFEVHDDEVVLDDEGMELPDLDAAIREAVKSLPAIAGEAISKGDDRQSFAIIVRDSERRPVYTAAMSFCGTRL